MVKFWTQNLLQNLRKSVELDQALTQLQLPLKSTEVGPAKLSPGTGSKNIEWLDIGHIFILALWANLLWGLTLRAAKHLQLLSGWSLLLSVGHSYCGGMVVHDSNLVGPIAVMQRSPQNGVWPPCVNSPLPTPSLDEVLSFQSGKDDTITLFFPHFCSWLR